MGKLIFTDKKSIKVWRSRSLIRCGIITEFLFPSNKDKDVNSGSTVCPGFGHWLKTVAKGRVFWCLIGGSCPRELLWEGWSYFYPLPSGDLDEPFEQ